MAHAAARLGTPLMPWQRLVADIVLEVDPATGRLAYREYVITVPRQSGKTTFVLAKAVQRAIGFGERQRILYTAQTRGSARLKWEDEHVAALEASRYRSMFTVRRQLGQEAIRWRNGSRHGITSNTEKAGHGETLDEGLIDEAFAQEDARLEQAFKPAMITRPQPQLGIISTAGTLKSVYLRQKVDAGRLRCEAGVAESVAYFEWSAPEDADPGDPATWWACMPALGHTITEDAVRADFESMKLAEFRRAYLNQWPDASPGGWLVIGEAAWSALAEPDAAKPVGPVAFAIDMTPARSHTAISVAGRREDGRTQVEVAEHRRGSSWAPARLLELVERYNPVAVILDPGSPAASLASEIESLGIPLVRTSVRDVAQACGAFYDAVVPAEGPPTLVHLDEGPLNIAVAGAARRDLGDAWAWSRRATHVDISPLVSSTLATWGLTKFAGEAADYDVLQSVY